MNLHDAYDPETFRREGKQLIDRLADLFLRLSSDEPGPVIEWTPPEELLPQYPAELEGGADFQELCARTLSDSIQVRHPRFVGHQVSVPLPTAALTDLLASFLSNGMAIYEMGQVATVMERRVTDWLCAKVGWGPEASGILTAGGTLGNLTALLAARQSRAPYDAWEQSGSEHPPLAILTNDQAHYSIARIGRILGLGAQGIIPVPVDTRFRMRPDALPAALQQARDQGRHVIAVIANVCSTATGSYDPLPPIADFCESEGLWLHADGAHGASLLLSKTHRHRLEGIERADSVLWDLHKMMMMPALTTALLFRRTEASYVTFAQKASYLFEGPQKEDWSEIGQRTFECTKRMMSLRPYISLAVHGEKVFEEYVDTTVALAATLADLVDAAPDFELAIRPEANIVCFRHRPAGIAEGDLDALQSRLKLRLMKSGEFYLVQTTLPRGRFLRCTMMNPFTTSSDLEVLLEALRAAV